MSFCLVLLNLLLAIQVALAQNLIISSKLHNSSLPVYLSCHPPDFNDLPDEVTVISEEGLSFCSWENKKGSYHILKAPRLDDNKVGCNLEVDYQKIMEEDLFEWKCRVQLPHTRLTVSANIKLDLLKPDKSIKKVIGVPKTLSVTAYDITLIPQASEDYFEGETTIHMKAQEYGNRIVLQSKKLYYDLSRLLWVKIGNATVAISGVEFDNTDSLHLLILILEDTFQVGDSLSVTLFYHGRFDDSLKKDLFYGLYRKRQTDADYYAYDYGESYSYVGDEEDDHYFYMTHLEPDAAKSVFPCLDEPEFKARFKISVVRREDFLSLSNMPKALNAFPLNDRPGFVLDVFEETPPMSTYLVAIVVCKGYVYREVQSSLYGKTMRFWSSPELSNNTIVASLIAPKMYDSLASLLRVEDPLPKLDFVATVNMRIAAMENWGLFTFMPDYMLQSIDDQSPDLIRMIGHEMAHLWFGNLVTPQSWSQLYLKEGFATHLGFLAGHAVMPSVDVEMENELAYYLSSRENSSGLPIVRDYYTDVTQLFGLVTYAKSGAIVKMFRHAIGDEAFFFTLSNLLQKNKYGNINEGDLFDSFDDVFTMPQPPIYNGSEPWDPNVSFHEVMSSWTHQAGYPTIRVTKEEDNVNIVTIEQVINEEDPERAFWVPISYTYVGGDFEHSKGAMFWLHPKDIGVPIKYNLGPVVAEESVLIFNVDGAFYYRVIYEQDHFRQILQAVEAEPSSVSRLSKIQINFDMEQGQIHHLLKDGK